MRLKRIIVQDSDKDIREILRFVLEEDRFEVCILADPLDVISMVRSFNPDIVLLDFKISGEDCKKTCREIKQVSPDLPVLAMSCNLAIREAHKASGFDDYILKPFDIKELCNTLNQNISRHASS